MENEVNQHKDELIIEVDSDHTGDQSCGYMENEEMENYCQHRPQIRIIDSINLGQIREDLMEVKFTLLMPIPFYV